MPAHDAAPGDGAAPGDEASLGDRVGPSDRTGPGDEASLGDRASLGERVAPRHRTGRGDEASLGDRVSLGERVAPSHRTGPGDAGAAPAADWAPSGIAASYDAVARRYAREIGGELAAKPVDRALYRLFAELVSAFGEEAAVGDVGCGPGHVAAYLAELGLRPLGVDPSLGMLEAARDRYPDLDFALGSFAVLPVPDGGWAGAVAPYSIIHVRPATRPAAWAELARAIRTGGWLLVAFHIEAAGQPAGSLLHVAEWWGHAVDIDFHYIDPVAVVAELAISGFDLVSRTDREPWLDIEYPSRRSYLLARRR